MKPKTIKLLIAEDDEVFLKTICDLFSLFHFDVKGVGNGLQAWEEIQKNSFHIVITDLRMPGLSGFELLQKIKKKNAEFPKVIAISGYSDHSLMALHEAGVDGFFAKPFDIAAVKACISKCLVSPSERWSRPYSGASPVALAKRFPILEKAAAAGDFLLGREGFFLAGAGYSPKIGEVVSFDFSFGGPKPEAIIRGFGKVAFECDKTGGSSAGIGIEIMSLEPSSLATVLDLLKKSNSVASIPGGS